MANVAKPRGKKANFKVTGLKAFHPPPSSRHLLRSIPQGPLYPSPPPPPPHFSRHLLRSIPPGLQGEIRALFSASSSFVISTSCSPDLNNMRAAHMNKQTKDIFSLEVPERENLLCDETAVMADMNLYFSGRKALKVPIYVYCKYNILT